MKITVFCIFFKMWGILIPLSPSVLFSMLIFSCFTFSITAYKVLVMLYFFVESIGVIFFSCSCLIFLIFFSLLFFAIIQHQCCIFYSLFNIPVSINTPVYAVLTGSLNIIFKVFPCILSISFILSFFLQTQVSK